MQRPTSDEQARLDAAGFLQEGSVGSEWWERIDHPGGKDRSACIQFCPRGQWEYSISVDGDTLADSQGFANAGDALDAAVAKLAQLAQPAQEDTLRDLLPAHWRDFLDADILDAPRESVVGEACFSFCVIVDALLTLASEDEVRHQLKFAALEQCRVWLNG
jgi:hypothetical protein